METQMTDLKPCPFCGGKVSLTEVSFCLELMKFECDGCGTKFIMKDDIWNCRHYPSEVQQAIDKQKPELAIITKELGYHPDGDVYEVGCPDCGKVLRYVNFVRGATTDCIRHCMDCGKKMNVRIDSEVEDE